MKRYYQILELSINASPRKIKDQYRKLAKQYHPDRTTNPAEKARYAEKFKEINEAYEALAEIVKRAGLDPYERKLDFLYEQGRQLCAERKWSQAMVVFTEIMAIDPTYRDARTWLRESRRKHKHLANLYSQANTHFQQQRWAEAMTGFSSLLNESPNYRDAAKKYKKARREQLMVEFINN